MLVYQLQQFYTGAGCLMVRKVCVCLCVCVGIGYIGSLLCSIQFCYCPETSLKSKVYCKYAWAWIHRYTHSTISFINSKYQSDISSDNLLSKMKCTVSIKYTLDFRFSTKEYKISHYYSLLITCWNGNIFDILVKYQNFTFFFFLTVPCSLWDLSFLTRDWTWDLGSEGMES